MSEFDVLIVGSGMTGGWMAKEFCEAGFKTVVIERGPLVEHGSYPTENKQPWDMPWRGLGDPAVRQRHPASGEYITEYDEHFFVRDLDEPYRTATGKPFSWVRGYQLGGRSLTWTRHVPRWGPADFTANARDGRGLVWPLGYDDLAPWYDRVERFIGVSGAAEGLPHWPDGQFLPPFELTPPELALREAIRKQWPDRHLIIGRSANLTSPHMGRGQCQSRSHCSRGCSFGAYFSSLSSTLPAAQATGNLTILTDSVATRILTEGDRASAAEIYDVKARRLRRITARTIVLCPSAMHSVQLLLNSASADHPQGLGNGSGLLGHYVMDHVRGARLIARVPGFDDVAPSSNRPVPAVIPRFRNLGERQTGFARGYHYQGGSFRLGWSRGAFVPGLGPSFKSSLQRPGSWMIGFSAFGEPVPNKENRVFLARNDRDRFGVPRLTFDVAFGPEEEAMMIDAAREGAAMLEAAGFEVVAESRELAPPGSAVHEMGGAAMGVDPRLSVTDPFSRLHAVPNLVIGDGAVMPSAACQNPSLTYMALAARAAARTIETMRTAGHG